MKPRMLRVLPCLALLGAGAPGGAAWAATFNVNSTADTNVPNNGQCTLREALHAANTNTTSADCQGQTGAWDWDEIHLGSGTYTLGSNLVVSGTVGFFASALGNVILVNPSNNPAIFVSAGQFAEATRIIFQGGRAPVMWVDDTAGLNLYNIIVRDKSFSTGNGQSGGIVVDTSAGLFMTDSTITNSIASIKGAAIFTNPSGFALIEYSTLDNNQANQYGGAVLNQGTFGCFNSTLSGNRANLGGGALMNTGSSYSYLYNCTVTKSTNHAFLVNSGTVEIGDTIIADQTSGDTCLGTLTSIGNNLLGGMAGCSMVPQSGDQTNQLGNLGVLQYNGGTTRTHLPNLGSAALSATPNCPWDDQRHNLRPAGPCDIGSVER